MMSSYRILYFTSQSQMGSQPSNNDSEGCVWLEGGGGGIVCMS